MTELTNNESERERLESLTRTYASWPLAGAFAGVLLIAYGVTYLVGHPTFVLRYHEVLLAPLMFLGMFLLPRLLRRWYYEPRFGHVERFTPPISDRQFWLMVSAAAVFCIILGPFVILPGLDRIDDAWLLVPSAFFLGIGICLAGLFVFVKDRSSFPEIGRA